MLFFLFLLFGLMPLLWQQVGELFQQLPAMISWTQKHLLQIAQPYSAYISERQVMEVISALRSELTHLGQRILSLSLASVRVIIWIVVYIFLMPLLVFFFLKDKNRILGWFSGFLPEDRRLSLEVWYEVDEQIGNYVRGKFWEILVVWIGSYITFRILDLQFAMLLSFFVGLSVLVPYIGATVMAIPVALVAYFQWGWCSDFAWAVIAYILIQVLDGNVLVPFLFSEAVNLHPVAIIVAVLVFGGTLGFWGVFFAIPLATLVQAVLNAWTRHIRKGGDAAGKGEESTETPSPA
jgi:putative permease